MITILALGSAYNANATFSDRSATKKQKRERLLTALENISRLPVSKTDKQKRRSQRHLSTIQQLTANTSEKLVILRALLTPRYVNAPLASVIQAVFGSGSLYEDVEVLEYLYQYFKTSSEEVNRMAAAKTLSRYSFRQENVHDFLLFPFRGNQSKTPLNREQRLMKTEKAFYLLTSPYSIKSSLGKVTEETLPLIRSNPELLDYWFYLMGSRQGPLQGEKLKALTKMHLKLRLLPELFRWQPEIQREITALSYADPLLYEEAVAEYNSEQIGYCPFDEKLLPPPEVR